MVVFPNAKINIGLHVLNKRDDGFHNLESIFYPIGLCDILEIVKAKEFAFTQSGLEISGNPKKNLVVKAYEILKREYKIGPVAIHLHKVIPTEAGLGGGSSDATFTLKLLRDIFDLKIEEDVFLKLALELGSDCPFFLFNKPCLVTGRGEKIIEIDFNLTNYWIKLIHPAIKISTKDAFEKIKPNRESYNLESVINRDTRNNLKRFINDFEIQLFYQYQELQLIKDQLKKEGAIYASLSGSGSSLYGIFEIEPKKTETSYFEYIGQLAY